MTILNRPTLPSETMRPRASEGPHVLRLETGRVEADPAASRRWAMEQVRRLHLVAVVLMTLVFLYASAIPFTFAIPDFGSRLARMTSASSRWRERTFDWFANGVAFIPLGFAGAGAVLSPCGRRSRRRSAAIRSSVGCLALACLAEGLQFWLPLRVPSLRDILALEMGAITGIGVWAAVGGRVTRILTRVMLRLSPRGRQWYFRLKSPALFCAVTCSLMVIGTAAKPSEWFEMYRRRTFVQHHPAASATRDVGLIATVSLVAGLGVVVVCQWGEWMIAASHRQTRQAGTVPRPAQAEPRRPRRSPLTQHGFHGTLRPRVTARWMDHDRESTANKGFRRITMWRQRMRPLAEYLAFRSLVCFVQALSPRMCARIAERLAAVVHNWVPRKWTRYAVARENIRLAFPDACTEEQIDRLIYRMWVHLFRLVAEMILLPRKLRLDNVVDVVVFRNKPAVVRALCSNRPVIVLSGHFGNWELAVSIFGLFGFKMGLVARELDNPYINRWFYESRKFTGHRPISKNGGGGDMVAVLERGGSLAMLGDQDAGKSGMFVNFFGRPASSYKSIALVAREYKALICVGYARRLNETLANGLPRFELGCEEVVDPLEFHSADALREITQRYTSALERVVRRAPEQYFWVHRRWKSLPNTRAARRKKAA